MTQQLDLTAEPSRPTISRPPTSGEIFGDRFFRGLCFSFAWLTILLVVLIVLQIGERAVPAMQAQGWRFLTTDKWDAGKNKFGILPEIGGTLYSSILGVGLGTIFGVAVAIFLTQDFIPPSLGIAAQEHHRAAGRHPQRGLWPVGHLRGHPDHPAGVPTGCTTIWAGFPSSARA